MAAAQGGLVRSFCSAGGVVTEVLSLAASGPPQLQMLVIPGNPGNANYYASFMRLLHRKLGGRAEVVAISYAGHDDGAHNTGEQLFDLDDQVTHKVHFCAEHLLLPGRPPLVIVGHSIGAYLAVHAVSQLEQQQQQQGPAGQEAASDAQPLALQPTLGMETQAAAALDPAGGPSTFGQQGPYQGHPHLHARSRPPIAKVVALMPFIETNMALWRQRMLRVLSHQYQAMGWVAHVLSQLPHALQESFICWWTGGSMDAEAVATTRRLLHRPSILNNFRLAKAEFRDLSRPFDFHLMRRLQDRLHLLACPKDMWLSDDAFTECLRNVPGLSSTWAPDVTHAFCVSLPQCQRVAEVVVSQLPQQLLEPAGRPGAAAAGSRAGQHQGQRQAAAGQEADIRVDIVVSQPSKL